jgi:hypothetical protein
MDGFGCLERKKKPYTIPEFEKIFDWLKKKKEKNVYGPSMWIHLYLTCSY